MHKKLSKSSKAKKNSSNENTDSTLRKKAKRVKKSNTIDENPSLIDLKNVKPSVFSLENNELIQSLDEVEFLDNSENHIAMENNTNCEQSLFSSMNLTNSLGILQQAQAEGGDVQQKIQSNQIEYNDGWENDISDDQVLEMSGLANVQVNDGIVDGMIDCSSQKYEKSHMIDYFNFENKGHSRFYGTFCFYIRIVYICVIFAMRFMEVEQHKVSLCNKFT